MVSSVLCFFRDGGIVKLEPSSSRDPRIDFLRGFALVSILINHAQQLAGIYYFVPTIKHLHPGLSDSAELFVFLSGLSIALAYGPRIRVGQTGQANVLILLRWFRIYALHLLIVGAVVLLFRLVYDGPAERVPVGLAGLSGNGQAWLDVDSEY
ncbi:MAG: hypothetical protein CMN76_10040 [Spirochaetaceae bacterium]|nr:hypothetical protein [Spirochaetaceae bacterium]